LEFTAWFGKLNINEEGEVEDCQAFEKDPEKLAEVLVSLQETSRDEAVNAPDLRQVALDFGFVELERLRYNAQGCLHQGCKNADIKE